LSQFFLFAEKNHPPKHLKMISIHLKIKKNKIFLPR
jgi:hypothetical protein